MRQLNLLKEWFICMSWCSVIWGGQVGVIYLYFITIFNIYVVQIRRQVKLRSHQIVEVIPIQLRKCNLKFNQDEFGMMKAKQPGFLFDHIARAARSEGPVIHSPFSSEDLSFSSSSSQSIPISGTQEKKIKSKQLPKQKRKSCKMTKAIKRRDKTSGSTDLMLFHDQIHQLKTS